MAIEYAMLVPKEHAEQADYFADQREIEQFDLRMAMTKMAGAKEADLAIERAYETLKMVNYHPTEPGD